jgi:hypothetical protein
VVGNINLILAFVWLGLGVFLLWADATGNGPGWRIRFTDNVSVGWLLIVLAAYNLVRWYTIRASRRARAEDEKAEWLRRAPRRRRDTGDVTPDPNFQFTDEPPPPGPITDRPPPEP